jgi:hypothetical protein
MCPCKRPTSAAAAAVAAAAAAAALPVAALLTAVCATCESAACAFGCIHARRAAPAPAQSFDHQPLHRHDARISTLTPPPPLLLLLHHCKAASLLGHPPLIPGGTHGKGKTVPCGPLATGALTVAGAPGLFDRSARHACAGRSAVSGMTQRGFTAVRKTPGAARRSCWGRGRLASRWDPAAPHQGRGGRGGWQGRGARGGTPA